MPLDHPSLPPFMSRQVSEARRFYLGTEGNADEPLTLVCGGWERSAPGYHIDRDGFPYFAVEVVAGGRGLLRLGGRDYVLTRGTVFTYGPGVAHEISTGPSDPLSKYFIDLAGSGAGAALASAGIAAGSCHGVADPAEVEMICERIVESGRRGTPQAIRIAGLHTQVLLLTLGEIRLPGSRRPTPAQETFVRCRDYIEKHCASLRTAEEVASACGVDPAYLSRLFRRFTGQPVYRFLLRLKMSEAATLLQRDGMNVSQTAEVFGMDPFHFSRVFKRVHGQAPSRFCAGRERTHGMRHRVAIDERGSPTPPD